MFAESQSYLTFYQFHANPSCQSHGSSSYAAEMLERGWFSEAVVMRNLVAIIVPVRLVLTKNFVCNYVARSMLAKFKWQLKTARWNEDGQRYDNYSHSLHIMAWGMALADEGTLWLLCSSAGFRWDGSVTADTTSWPCVWDSWLPWSKINMLLLPIADMDHLGDHLGCSNKIGLNHGLKFYPLLLTRMGGRSSWGFNILGMSPRTPSSSRVSIPLSLAHWLSPLILSSQSHKKSFPYKTMSRYKKGVLILSSPKAEPDILYLGRPGSRREGLGSMRQERRRGQQGVPSSCYGCWGAKFCHISWEGCRVCSGLSTWKTRLLESSSSAPVPMARRMSTV